MLKVGLIGLDMSQAVAFTQLLNDPAHPHAIAGARVTVGYTGGSDDFELSSSRRDEYTRKVSDFGAEIVATAAEVAAAADLVLMTAVDGRAHKALFEEIVSHCKPTFIGKPMTLSSADAKGMFDLARSHGTPLSSCSALRFSPALRQATAGGAVTGCDVFGPTSDQPTQPGLFWYGIHCVEMVVAAMGVGCAAVSSSRGETADLTTLHWHDGRVATIRGVREGSSTFGITAHRASGPTYADTSMPAQPMTATLLEAILATLPAGKLLLPEADTMEVIRIIEAANRSQETRGIVQL